MNFAINMLCFITSVLCLFTMCFGGDLIKLGYITGSKKLHDSMFYRRPGQVISGAITMALDEINNDTSILPNHTLDFIIKETYGIESRSIKVTTELLQESISAYIGPQETCTNEGKIAAAFDIPMISYFCSEVEVSNLNEYPTFARTKPTDSQISKSVVSILKRFHWRKVTFVHTNEPDVQHTVDTIYELVFGHTVRGPLKLMKEKFLEDDDTSVNLLQYVSEFRNKLSRAREVAQSNLKGALNRMKASYDEKTIDRNFKSGDEVLALLPIPGRPLQARYFGPYSIDKKLLQDYDIEVTFRKTYNGPYFHRHTVNPFVKIVQETYFDTRIYIMLGKYYEFVGLMDHLHDRGLLDTGEYFVVGVHLGQYEPKNPQLYFQGIFEDNVTAEIQDAFKYFVCVVNSPPIFPGYDNFKTLINKYLTLPPFNFENHYENLGGQKIIRPEAAYLYDAVWLYAKACDETIRAGEDYMNGSIIISKLLTRSYRSAMGYMTRINHLGDAEGNYSLIAHMPHQDDENIFGLYPVGVFGLNENYTALPDFRFYDGLGIAWHDDKIPVDEPACGYRGQKCIPKKTYTKEIIASVAGGLTLVVSITAYLAYRNWKYENELASLLWKINCKEVNFKEQFGGSMASKPLVMSKRAAMVRVNSQMSLASQGEVDFRQLFTCVAEYKGSIVAVKKVHKKHIELTRNIKKELKLMRDLRHDNINPFIGACVDSPNIFVVTAYCSKGSLQDILENDDIQLDNMFIASLVFDIIRGMNYLHQSEIRSHGKLRSSNCVVDSRWVLKITDFGLHEFMDGAIEEDEGDFAMYRNMLWVAPELLQMSNPPRRGTQEGDVYSFGIMLYEIHGRNGPYGNVDLSPKEIIERVKYKTSDVPFRPWLGYLVSTPRFVIDVIRDCLSEEAIKRPDFKLLRSRLKPMQIGMKHNILDNMVAMMEKYACNLEAIVEERTDQLREEKKKTEDILHQMLPKTVAEQLKHGKEVEAEQFDCVTIYFSDICGFTAMSADSTPMQVVNLLNDLYTLFDSIIENYDVYKVETIGDAYMVCSGLPKRNGIMHAGEIASMSLHLLQSIKRFKIRHRPHDTIYLRVGIHSGPCVAGVVGLKMPRYCLFGDTVNTCSRMESNGVPLRIHCSEQTKTLLDHLGGYTTEKRGMVAMKGKGEVVTYWIIKEDKQKRLNRLSLRYSITTDTKYSGNNNMGYSVDQDECIDLTNQVSLFHGDDSESETLIDNLCDARSVHQSAQDQPSNEMDLKTTCKECDTNITETQDIKNLNNLSTHCPKLGTVEHQSKDRKETRFELTPLLSNH